MTTKTHHVLELLASNEVGLPASVLIFVAEDGVVRAVFTRRTDMAAAIVFANSLPHNRPVTIEDRTGVTWENSESIRRQRDGADDEPNQEEPL